MVNYLTIFTILAILGYVRTIKITEAAKQLTPKSKVEILVSRRQRVYNLMCRLIAEHNYQKVAQAEYLIRAIDNRLSNLTIKNLHQFN